MKNTIVDKSLDNIIIFCQSVTIRQLREKYIRKNNDNSTFSLIIRPTSKYIRGIMHQTPTITFIRATIVYFFCIRP